MDSLNNTNNTDTIKEIENTYKEISLQYEGSLFDKSDPYFFTYQRIHNAVTILFNYALKSQNDLITLNKLKKIMLDIKNIICDVMLPYEHDLAIRLLLAKYNYNPQKFLILNPTLFHETLSDI